MSTPTVTHPVETIPAGLEVEGARGWYCVQCGAPATYHGPSLSAAWPFVICQRVSSRAPHKSLSCGVVPGTRDLVAVSTALYQARRDRATIEHARTGGHKTATMGRACRRCYPDDPQEAHRG